VLAAGRRRAAAVLGLGLACLLALGIVAAGIVLARRPQPEIAGVQSTAEPAAPIPVEPTPTLAVDPQLDRARLAVRVAPGSTATAAPTSTVVVPLSDPAQRVRQFYAYLEQGEFEQMQALLSDHYKQTMVADPTLLRERTPPGRIDVQQADVVAIDPQRRSATVAVRVREVAGPPLPSEHVYVGTWHLVRGPTGWLLDQPDIQLE
jgi:hypothetical protein